MSKVPPVRRQPAGPSASLEVRLLGVLDFDSAVQLQERLVYDLSGRNDRQGALLLCEHPPLISIGREGSSWQVLADEQELAARELPVRWVSRSGGAVLHAPGQLAVYPLLPLQRLGIGLEEFRRRMEGVLLDVCHELRVGAKAIDGGPGIWGRSGQVGHFGAAVRSWITLHGMWLNVAPAPGWLRLVRSEACRGPGPTGDAARGDAASVEGRVSSLQEQLMRPVSMSAVREAVVRRLAAACGYQSVHTYTGHPDLVRRTARVCVEA